MRVPPPPAGFLGSLRGWLTEVSRFWPRCPSCWELGSLSRKALPTSLMLVWPQGQGSGSATWPGGHQGQGIEGAPSEVSEVATTSSLCDSRPDTVFPVPFPRSPAGVPARSQVSLPPAVVSVLTRVHCGLSQDGAGGAGNLGPVWSEDQDPFPSGREQETGSKAGLVSVLGTPSSPPPPSHSSLHALFWPRPSPLCPQDTE